MKTINIAPHIDELLVFDDPKYCENEGYACAKIQEGNSSKDFCPVFGKNLERKHLKSIKCQQCKAAYQKSVDLELSRAKSLIENGEYFELIKTDGTREIIPPEKISSVTKKEIFAEITDNAGAIE